MNPFTLIDLLGRPQFQLGFGLGLIGLATTVLVRRGDRPLPVWGIVVSVTSLAASYFFVGQRISLAVAVLLLIVGGELMSRNRPLGVLIAITGAAAVALRSGIPEVVWVQTGTAAFILFGGWTIARIDDGLERTGLPIWMVAASIFGVWATLPDTELARILMGATASTLLLGWPTLRARVGTGGAYAVAALIAWVIGVDGIARPGSIVGGWATLGGFLAAPLIHTRSAPLRWGLFAVHGVAVLIASRGAGLQEGSLHATAIAVPTLAVTVFAVHYLSNKYEQHGPDIPSDETGV